jgi:hypothetical protein
MSLALSNEWRDSGHCKTRWRLIFFSITIVSCQLDSSRSYNAIRVFTTIRFHQFNIRLPCRYPFEMERPNPRLIKDWMDIPLFSLVFERVNTCVCTRVLRTQLVLYNYSDSLTSMGRGVFLLDLFQSQIWSFDWFLPYWIDWIFCDDLYWNTCAVWFYRLIVG